jgi:predicted nucleic acid-binding protein
MGFSTTARIYLSSIVLLELYTGAHDAAQIQWIDNHLRLPFRARERIVSPMVNDYTRAGQILAELQRTKGYDLRKSYGLQNDVLIALTARRIGATVITKNRRDYEEIQAIRSFSLHVVS